MHMSVMRVIWLEKNTTKTSNEHILCSLFIMLSWIKGSKAESAEDFLPS
jgi:hypothetical protein